MCVLTGGHNDSPHTHVLHQLYLVYGESWQNMGWYYCRRCSKSTTRACAFSLGGLAFIMKKSEPLIIKEFGLGFYAVLSFTGQQYKKLFVTWYALSRQPDFCMARKIFFPRHAVNFSTPCAWRGVKENYLNGTQITQMRQMTTDFYFVQCSSLISLLWWCPLIERISARTPSNTVGNPLA